MEHHTSPDYPNGGLVNPTPPALPRIYIPLERFPGILRATLFIHSARPVAIAHYRLITRISLPRLAAMLRDSRHYVLPAGVKHNCTKEEMPESWPRYHTRLGPGREKSHLRSDRRRHLLRARARSPPEAGARSAR